LAPFGDVIGPEAEHVVRDRRVERAAPTLGQDKEYMYKELLGVSDEDDEQLVAEQPAGTECL